MNRKTLGTILKAGYCAGICVITVVFSIRDAKANLIREAEIEAGDPIRLESFFGKVPGDANFITAVSSIDTSVPSIYKIKIHHDLLFDETVTLKIEDTVGPKADGVTKTILSYEKLPQASEMVENVYDLSGISSIEYVKAPDISDGGIIRTPIRLTDNYGNSSVAEAMFVVSKDNTAPVIYGVKDITITLGQDVDLREGVYAVDSVSKNIPVKIDASKLNISKAGKYEITYTAVDDAGNTSTATSTVTVKKKVIPVRRKKKTVRKTSRYGNVDRLAAKVVKKLIKGNDVETARAIFKWVHKNIHYVHTASKATGKKAAYIGLTKHAGNCRVFAYTSRILLNKAGIRNMIVTRYPVTTRHYWNLVYMNGGWYHCDATPFVGHRGIYFKLTDAKLDKHHKFKKNKYPARATK